MNFKQWLNELADEITSITTKNSDYITDGKEYINITGKEVWRDCFNNGDTPRDTARKEFGYLLKEKQMSNIYENNEADKRQSNEDNFKTSRFSPRYRKLTNEEIKLHDSIKQKAMELEQLYDKAPSGRYRALALTSLEESVMWCIKEITL